MSTLNLLVDISIILFYNITNHLQMIKTFMDQSLKDNKKPIALISSVATVGWITEVPAKTVICVGKRIKS